MKNFQRSVVLYISLLCFSGGFAQEWEYSLELSLEAIGAPGEQLPFWLYHNQRGRLSENSNLAGWINAEAVQTYYYGDYVKFGAGAFYQDEFYEEPKLDELYAQYHGKWIGVILGQKQQEDLYMGLSASNRNILWSLNSRPLPGIHIYGDIPFTGLRSPGFGIQGTLAEYYLNDDREFKGAQLHHKSFHVYYKDGNGFRVRAGLQHFALWGGSSETRVQPGGLDTWFRIALGGGNEGEASSINTENQRNALANHLLSPEFSISQEYDDFYVEVFYNHIIEDASGYRLKNLPDGRAGIFFKRKDEERLFNGLMYEFTRTKNQGQNFNGLYDNYFNHGLYTSGWTYENRVIGSPFFTERPEGGGVSNNLFSMHHFGLSGQILDYDRVYPYKLLLSFGRNEGIYNARLEPAQDVVYFLTEFGLIRNVFDLNLRFGMEFNSSAAPIFGGGLHFRKRFDI